MIRMLIVIVAGAAVGLCNAFVIVKWLCCAFESVSLIEIVEKSGLVGGVFLVSSLPVGLLWAAFFASGAVGFGKLVGAGAGSLIGLVVEPPESLMLSTAGLISLPWEWVATAVGVIAGSVIESMLDPLG